MSADNQQERLIDIGWVLGFTDGEGCFSIAIQKNPSTKTGWQVFPEFVVTQGEKSLASLERLKEFFACGNIFLNRRHDNHREHLHRYCVRNSKDLREKIIPFFKHNALRTSKQEDFEKFVEAIKLVGKGKHLTLEGIKEIANIVKTMNRKTPPRFLASSETIRQIPQTAGKI